MSTPASTPALPRTWRPLGPRIVGGVLGPGVVVAMVVVWLGFDEQTQSGFTALQLGTLVVLLLMGGACLHALLRSRVEAHEDRLVVVNGYRRRELAWAQVLAVRLPPGAPWVTLDLADGTSLSVMGIQGSDGARAQTAARELRGLVDRLSG